MAIVNYFDWFDLLSLLHVRLPRGVQNDVSYNESDLPLRQYGLSRVFRFLVAYSNITSKSPGLKIFHYQCALPLRNCLQQFLSPVFLFFVACSNIASKTPGLKIIHRSNGLYYFIIPRVSKMMFLVEKRNGGTQGREIATSNFEAAL